MIVWILCFRHLFDLIKGRIKSMAAPVVPIHEAIQVPISNIKVLIGGVPAKYPFMRIPPETVNRDNNRIIKGIYSKNITSKN